MVAFPPTAPADVGVAVALMAAVVAVVDVEVDAAVVAAVVVAHKVKMMITNILKIIKKCNYPAAFVAKNVKIQIVFCNL